MQVLQSVPRHATENNLEESLLLTSAASVSLINMFYKIPTLALVMLVVMVTVMNGGAASPVKPPHGPGDAGQQQHRRAKRDKDLVHHSCKGYYDRDTWNELSYVCEDCDNLYREFGFQEKCKRGCFSSELFVNCLYALEKDVEVFLDMASSLRGS